MEEANQRTLSFMAARSSLLIRNSPPTGIPRFSQRLYWTK